MSNDWIWLTEPNKLEFEHAGMKCLVLRDKFLWLGGYVGLEPGHQYFGKHFRHIDAKVHRGLNFSGKGDGERRPEGLWWVGFYCDRPGDVVPGRMDTLQGGESYRDVDYVRGEVEKLAEQLRDGK